MKKVILLAILCLCFMKSNAQLWSNSIDYQAPKKSVVIQNIDTIQNQELQNIKDRLTLFRADNKSSQRFIFAGTLLLAAPFISNINSDKSTICFIGGAGCLLIGTIFYLDSFKYLNFKRPFNKLEWIVD